MYEQPLPTRPPTIGSIISSSVRDTLALTMTQRIPYIVIIVLALFAALPLMSTGLPQKGFIPSFQVGLLSLFFALPAAIRTFIPEFRMTFGKWVMFIAVGFGFAIAFELGLVLLIIPGVLLAVRWYFAPLLAILGDSGNPFGLSWIITKGVFWSTLGFLLLVGFLTSLAVLLPAAIGFAAAVASPLTLVIFSPLVAAIFILAVNFQWLAIVRWTMALRGRAMVTTAIASPEWSPATP